jgi:hypothetical protein
MLTRTTLNIINTLSTLKYEKVKNIESEINKNKQDVTNSKINDILISIEDEKAAYVLMEMKHH